MATPASPRMIAFTIFSGNFGAKRSLSRSLCNQPMHRPLSSHFAFESHWWDSNPQVGKPPPDYKSGPISFWAQWHCGGHDQLIFVRGETFSSSTTFDLIPCPCPPSPIYQGCVEKSTKKKTPHGATQKLNGEACGDAYKCVYGSARNCIAVRLQSLKDFYMLSFVIDLDIFEGRANSRCPAI